MSVEHPSHPGEGGQPNAIEATGIQFPELDTEQTRMAIEEIFSLGNTQLISDRLFGPRGFFSRFTQSREERRDLVKTEAFRNARRRLTELELGGMS